MVGLVLRTRRSSLLLLRCTEVMTNSPNYHHARWTCRIGGNRLSSFPNQATGQPSQKGQRQVELRAPKMLKRSW